MDALAAALDMAPESASPCRGTLDIELRCLDRSYAHLRVLDPRVRARLCASLSLEGQRHPVLVVGRELGRYVLIDGYHRVDGLVRLGHDTVKALLLDMSEPEALSYCHRMQSAVQRSALEDGWLVAELHQQGQSLAQIGQALNRSTSWVSRRLGLARALPEKASAVVRRGAIPAHGAMKSLVPLARANKVHCERLCEQLGDARLSTRQIGQIYAAYRAGDVEQRERIANAPLLFLEAKRAITRLEPDGAAGALVHALDAASLSLQRAADSARRAWRLEPPSLSNAAVERAGARCTHAYEELVRHLEEPDAD